MKTFIIFLTLSADVYFFELLDRQLLCVLISCRSQACMYISVHVLYV